MSGSSSGQPGGVYFAFADGALDYDCASCDRRCCRGADFATHRPGEEARLVELHPALRLLTDLRGASTPARSFLNLEPGCWFLDGPSCRLFGRPERPSGCTLFPFNVFGRLRGALTVTPHPLCPIGVRRELTGRRHDELGALLGALGPARVGDCERVRLDATDARDVLGLEVFLRDLGPGYFDPGGELDYAALALAATRRHLAALPLAELGDREIAERREVVDARSAAWAAFLGCTAPPELASPLLVPFSPALRLDALSGEVEDLSLSVLALGFLARLLQRVGSSETPPSYKTLVELANSTEHLLWTLVHIAETPRPARGSTQLFVSELELDVAERFELIAARIDDDDARPLGEILDEALPREPAERSALLMTLTPLLREQVVFSSARRTDA